MLLLRTLLCAVVGAGALAGSAGAAPAPGSLADPWPALPLKYSTIMAKAAFKHDYETVWSYLSPTYQSAVSQSRWLACQKQNPVAPPGVTIKSVKVADSTRVPVNLPLLGHQSLRQVSLQVLFSRGGSQQIALAYAYWIKNNKGKWVAVWMPPVYAKYKSGGCDPLGPARGLY